MNSRERILAAIERKDTDRTPVAPPFQGYWALGIKGVSVKESIEAPAKAAKVQMEVCEQCGFDAIETMWDWLSCVEEIGCEVRIPESGSIPTWSHILEEAETFDGLPFPDPEKDYRMVSSMRTTEIIRDAIRDEKFLYTTMVSPFTLVGELRGVEPLMMDTFSEPDFVKDMLNYAAEVVSLYSEVCMESGVDGVILCDPTASGSLISAESFVEFSRPYIMEAGVRIKKANGRVLVHICGDTNDRLEQIADIGADIFSADSLVDLNIWKDTVSDRQSILGNVRPAQTLFSGTPEKAYAEAVECIRTAGERGFILGAGCDIAPGTPMENVIKMCQAVNSRS